MDANKSFSIYFLLLATMLVHCQGWKKSKYWGLQDGAPKNKQQQQAHLWTKTWLTIQSRKKLEQLYSLP